MLDSIDRDIIQQLQIDGRRSFTDMARVLGISEGTIRNRVARLLDDQVIQIVGMIDPGQMGFDAPAMIGVQVQPSQLEEVAAIVAGFPEVSYLIMVSGGYDLFVEVLCKDRDHLGKFLSGKLMRVPGIMRTQTFLTLRTYKMAYGASPSIPSASPEMPSRE
jgi:Lrp/AsnC family transcriptional regulator for asnA, asnC and gidA